MSRRKIGSESESIITKKRERKRRKEKKETKCFFPKEKNRQGKEIITVAKVYLELLGQR